MRFLIFALVLMGASAQADCELTAAGRARFQSFEVSGCSRDPQKLCVKARDKSGAVVVDTVTPKSCTSGGTGYVACQYVGARFDVGSYDSPSTFNSWFDVLRKGTGVRLARCR